MSTGADLHPTSDHPAEGTDEGAELFEDENEQFIRSLEKPAQTPTTAPGPSATDQLDSVAPDVEPPHEPQQPPVAAKVQAPEVLPVVEEPITALNQVAVTIHLEVGQVSCSLQKLIDLKENDLLELNQPVGQTVNLCVEGRLIGKAQLVRLGDQLGLRIHELADR